MAPLWAVLLKIALGFLGELLAEFIRQTVEDKMDDPALSKEILDVVRMIELRPHGLRGSAKARVARSNIRLRQPQRTEHLKDAALNRMIEVAVVRVDREFRTGHLKPTGPLVVG